MFPSSRPAVSPALCGLLQACNKNKQRKPCFLTVVGIGSTPKLANTAIMPTSVFLPSAWVASLPMLQQCCQIPASFHCHSKQNPKSKAIKFCVSCHIPSHISCLHCKKSCRTFRCPFKEYLSDVE